MTKSTKQVLNIFIIAQVIVLSYGKTLNILRHRNTRDAKIHEDESPITFSEDIQPRAYMTNIRDIIEYEPPIERDTSEEEALEDLSRVPIEVEAPLGKSAAVEGVITAPINGIGRIPLNRDILPNSFPVRQPIPPDGRVANGLYTDIARVEPINNYLLSRISPDRVPRPRPIPAPEISDPKEVQPKEASQRENTGGPRDNDGGTEKFNLGPLSGLFDLVKPSEQSPLKNRARWALYFGQVFLGALTTLIDGTQTALKEYLSIGAE